MQALGFHFRYPESKPLEEQGPALHLLDVPGESDGFQNLPQQAGSAPGFDLCASESFSKEKH